ncbi:amidohydrolase family protein [Streptomyces swartbergensis]|uniref:amidohydrolase family protein n=1 Tax=Streptomyces swartbergensis TaxID=487165 RepID=UPI00382EDB7F
MPAVPPSSEFPRPHLDVRARTSEQDRQIRRIFAHRLRLVRELHGAGVRLAAGTGTGYPVPGFALLDELALLVAAGITPAEALRAATRDAVRTLGLAAVGTVASGQAADLLVLDADPLRDIRNTRRIHDVVVDDRDPAGGTPPAARGGGRGRRTDPAAPGGGGHDGLRLRRNPRTALRQRPRRRLVPAASQRHESGIHERDVQLLSGAPSGGFSVKFSVSIRASYKAASSPACPNTAGTRGRVRRVWAGVRLNWCFPL